jgi:hypothetical protein
MNSREKAELGPELLRRLATREEIRKEKTLPAPCVRCRHSMWNPSKKLFRNLTKCKQAATKHAAVLTATVSGFSMHINSFMSGNQSFNQFLYAPLTRVPLRCSPEVNFIKDGVHEAQINL